jgi:hypothetical protein
MKRLALVLALAGLFAPSLSAADLSAEELKRATDYLRKTSREFLAATQGLSPAQLAFKSTPDRWSVAEVAEHIAATEDRLRGLVEKQVLKAPPRAEPVNVQEIDDFILQVIPDRAKKAQAPEELKPTNRFGTAAETLQHFTTSRAKTTALLQETPGLRDHAIDSPLGKKLDAYQWILFIAAHCERHTRQIAEVKADPNFPQR